MTSPYKLSAYETVWEDDCTSCPSNMKWQGSGCSTRSSKDGRCFRGPFGSENDWFEYQFDFPPQWSTGSVSYTYEFNYWALGTWEKDKKSEEGGGSVYCSSGNSVATIGQCPTDMHTRREKKDSCEGWSEWTSGSGSFDPYTEWQASDGAGGDSLACYLYESYTHSTSEDRMQIGFYSWDNKESAYGISGPTDEEAWVVSDFKITFSPPPFTSTRITTTETPATTKTPTSTETPTTTTETPTTTTKTPTTTTETPTSEEPQSTEGPQTTAHSTEEPQSTEWRPTTESPQTTGLIVSSNSEEPTTTSSATGGGSGGGGGYNLMFIAGGSVGLIAALCFIVGFFLRRRRKKQREDGEWKGVNMGRVTSLSQVPKDVEMPRRRGWSLHREEADVADMAFVPGSRRVSNVMRTGAAALSGMEPGPRPSLLLAASGVLTPAGQRPGQRPAPLPPAIPPPPAVEPEYAYGGMLPSQPRVEERVQGTPGHVAYGHYGAGAAVGGGHGEGGGEYTAYEDWMMEGDGDVTGAEIAGAFDEGPGFAHAEGGDRLTGAAKLEGRVELKKIFMQMKIDARTEEDKTTAKKLDLALELEPKKMEEEFQVLVQMGVDTGRITELLMDKADNVLLVKGIVM